MLANGEVLITGGFGGGQALAAVERFNPAIAGWTNTGSMQFQREYMAQILLPNGKVLVTDGVADSIEIYDPASGLWTFVDGVRP